MLAIRSWSWRKACALVSFAVAYSLLLTLATHAQSKSDSPGAKVDQLFEKWNNPNSPGCSLAVIRNGDIIYKRGYGMADLDHGIPNTPTTVFHIASTSKQFTAAAIVLLAQEGKLSFDDPIRKYLPEMPDFGTPITIRHLLHHTSGIRDQWELLLLAGWRYSLDLITDDDIMSLLVRQKELNFQPGDDFSYSNSGYTLLGQIVKRVSGKSLREFTTERIFQPLGMADTHFRDDHAEIIKNQAYGYVPAPGGKFRLSITNFDTVGATSLLTTVEDLARWDQNFYDKKVGGNAFVREMLEQGRLNNGKQLEYARGLMVSSYRGLPIVEHAGGDAGYSAHLMRFPQQRFSVACLCNTPANASSIARKVADIYLSGEFTEPSPVAPVTAAQPAESELAGKAGFYWDEPTDNVVNIVVANGVLNVGSEPGAPLQAVSPDTFRMADVIEFRFENSPAGDKLLHTHFLITLGDGGSQTFRMIAASKPANLSEYAADYASEEIDPVFHLELKDGKLVLQHFKAAPTTLQSVSGDLFLVSGESLRFTRDPNNKISGFLLSSSRTRHMRFHRLVASREAR